LGKTNLDVCSTAFSMAAAAAVDCNAFALLAWSTKTMRRRTTMEKRNNYIRTLLKLSD